MRSRQSQNHIEEAPISLLSSIFANSNRDPKKKREPYKMEDFFLYQLREDRNIPSGVFGAAAMELVRLKLFPKWGLFAFKALKEGSNGRPPQLLAYIGEDVMILAPVVDGKELSGMIVGRESAQGKQRNLVSPCGSHITVSIPPLAGKFYAVEDVTMRIVR